MLNFQTDYDLNTGEQVLTCFLLPQVEFQTDKHGKLKNFKSLKPSSHFQFATQYSDI